MIFLGPSSKHEVAKKINGWVGKRKMKVSTEIGAASHDQA
jgi:hypothetical protein